MHQGPFLAPQLTLYKQTGISVVEHSNAVAGSLEHAEDAAVKSQSHEVLDGLMAAPRGAAFPSAKSSKLLAAISIKPVSCICTCCLLVTHVCTFCSDRY